MDLWFVHILCLCAHVGVSIKKVVHSSGDVSYATQMSCKYNGSKVVFRALINGENSFYEVPIIVLVCCVFVSRNCSCFGVIALLIHLQVHICIYVIQ